MGEEEQRAADGGTKSSSSTLVVVPAWMQPHQKGLERPVLFGVVLSVEPQCFFCCPHQMLQQSTQHDLQLHAAFWLSDISKRHSRTPELSILEPAEEKVFIV